MGRAGLGLAWDAAHGDASGGVERDEAAPKRDDGGAGGAPARRGGRDRPERGGPRRGLPDPVTGGEGGGRGGAGRRRALAAGLAATGSGHEARPWRAAARAREALAAGTARDQAAAEQFRRRGSSGRRRSLVFSYSAVFFWVDI